MRRRKERPQPYDLETTEGRQHQIIQLLESVRHLCIAVLVVMVLGTFVLIGTWNALLTNREHIDRFGQQHVQTEHILCDYFSRQGVPLPPECLSDH